MLTKIMGTELRAALLKSIAVGTVTICLLGCPLGSDSSRHAADSIDQNPLPGPENLLCATSQMDLFFSWENPDDYEEIRVSRNGLLIAVLDGNASSISDSLEEVGVFSYSFVGIVEGGESTEASVCEVETSPIEHVSNLTCTFRPDTFSIALAWMLPPAASYDSLRLVRDGQLIAALSGHAVAYLDSSPGEGINHYELRGVRGGVSSAAERCEVDAAVAQIANLSGSIDRSTGDILLEWQNGDTYDEIVVLCGGEEVATLDGSQTSFRFEHDALGLYTFALCGRCGELESLAVYWQVDVGRLVWDADPGSVPAGYYVYVWPQGDATPDLFEPSLVLGSQTTISLHDLLCDGVLPACREATAFNVAIAAYDGEGNTSAMSTPMMFMWQVMDMANVQ